MTFRLRHEFKDGALIAGTQLAHCAHCETLRITVGDEPPRYQQRRKESTADAPPCLEAKRERRTRAATQSERERATRDAEAREDGSLWSPGATRHYVEAGDPSTGIGPA